MAEGQVYDIPAVRWQWFQDQVAGLKKKINKLKIDDKISMMVVGKRYEELMKGKGNAEILEVFISVPEIRIPGYKFIGTIDHALEGGNIIRTMMGETMPDKYRTAQSECEHCNVNRRRNDTFVIWCDDGTHKQVGSSCLRDFTGHKSANDLAKLAKFLSQIPEIVRVAYDHGRTDIADPFFETLEVAEQAAQRCLDFGFTSAKEARENTDKVSTAWRVRDKIRDFNPVSDRAKTIAVEALAWAREMPAESSDWAHNAQVIANSVAVNWRHIPLLVSVVGIHYRNTHKDANKANQHIGTPGQRVRIYNPKLISSRPSKFGYMHEFEDSFGNRIIWFTKDELDHRSKFRSLEGKVKEHNEFNGRKSTTISYAKLT